MSSPPEQRSSLPPPSQAAALWLAEAPDDARAFLDQHPELRANKGQALDLAYDEYCRRAEAGEAPDVAAFCERFPTFRSSLRRVLQAHEYLEANPRLTDEPEPIAWPIAGETFLGFRLLRELGSGSFARVFLAEEPDLGGRLVAVKVSPHGGGEAQTLGRLDHPHVVKVYAVRKDERSGLTAVCMPYLGDATLQAVVAARAAGAVGGAGVILDAARGDAGPAVPGADWLAPHPLLAAGTYAEGVCLLGAQLADALAFLHDRDIYHRDLKPSNVLLCPDGRPMLLDFNLSADPHAGGERLGGTLPYMSPEQVQATFGPDRPAAPPVDGRSDLFSLGVILFELLTGRQPFGDVPRGRPSPEDGAALMARRQQGAPPVRDVCREAPPALADMIDRCLAFERQRRPRDAAEAAAALRRALAWHRRTLRRLRRHPRQLVAAAALTLALASAGAAYVATRPPQAEVLRRQAVEAARRGDTAQALDLIDRGVARDPQAAALRTSALLYQRQGRFGLAWRDYKKANDQEPKGWVSACIGYCLSQDNDHPHAVESYEQAIAAEFKTAAVYNNLAYSQVRNGQAARAGASVEEALRRDPNLSAGHLNRFFLLRRKLNLSNPSQGVAALPEVRRALNEAFAPGRTESAPLHEEAAELCAVADRVQGHAGWDEEALAHLRKACDLGLVLPERPAGRFYDRRLRSDPRFAALPQAPSPAAVEQTTPYLVDPMRGDPPP